jgi:hypothetical protein
VRVLGQGRFTQADPIIKPYYVGLYKYANNNPINFRDPSGYWAFAIPFITFCVSIGPVGWFVLAFVGGCAVGAIILAASSDEQDLKLTPGEIGRLEDGSGESAEEIKTPHGKGAGKYELYKDKYGNVKVKPRGGNGPGEETGYNINDY